MKRRAMLLLLALTPSGCFPFVHPANDPTPIAEYRNEAVTPEQVTPANARAMSKALEREMDQEVKAHRVTTP